MDRAKELGDIAQEIEACPVCRAGKTGRAVPGEGNPFAKIFFVGEAPGKEEAKTGRPFIGRSGKLLRSLIREIGLKEEEVFITSPVKYLPLRGTPSPSDIVHGRTHLFRQLSVIDPGIIVLLGSVAASAVLGEKVPITREHGQAIRKKGKIYFVTFHPSAALRFPQTRQAFKEDFQKLKSLLSGT